MQNSRNLIFNWKPAEIMLAVLFLLAPLYYHPNLGGEGLRLPNNSTIWLVALVFIAYSLNKVIRQPAFKLPRYFIFIAAFPILVTLGGFITGVEQPLKWLFRLLFIMGGLAFFFSLFQHNLKQGRADKLLYIIALSGLIHAAIGITQIWLKADMPYLLPKSPYGVPSGLFQQINNQATFLVTVISLSLFLAARPLLYKRRLFMQLLLVITVLLSAYIVGVSGSRIGALTLFISVPLLIFALRNPLLRNGRFSATILLAIVMGFSAGLLPHSSKLVDKTVAMQSGYSGSVRLGIYKISLDLMAEKPVFGHGIGSFPRVWQFAKPAFYQQNPDAKLPEEMVGHPHNEIIQWLVEGGLIALTGIVLIVIGALLALRQTGWSRGLAYTAMLMPIVLHTQVELPLYMSTLHWFVLLILLALPFSHQLTSRNNSLTIYANKLAAISLWAIMGIFILFLLHTVRSNWDFVAFYKGEQRENPLQIAKQNPYLSEQAQWIDMSAMMYSSMQYGLKDNVEYYTNWGEQYLTKRPDVDLYRKLTDAYEFLGNKPAYCDVANRGFAIYPQAERLQRAVEYCQY